jgi:putative membrane protein
LVSKHLRANVGIASILGIAMLTGCSTSIPTASVPDASGGPIHIQGNAMDGQARVNAIDRHFVMKASEANLAEIKLGQLAVDRAHTPEVKAYGERMVRDHTKAQNELKQLADSLGLPLSEAIPPEAKAAMERLARLSGMEFDKAYMKKMVEDHEKAVALFRMEKEEGHHPALKGYAAKNLPVLKEHLQLARQILHGLGAR